MIKTSKNGLTIPEPKSLITILIPISLRLFLLTLYSSSNRDLSLSVLISILKLVSIL